MTGDEHRTFGAYQLVPLTTVCRHTVGLNWTAFGIEQVGRNAREILDRPAQYGAVVRLTAWLRCRYGIAVRVGRHRWYGFDRLSA